MGMKYLDMVWDWTFFFFFFASKNLVFDFKRSVELEEDDKSLLHYVKSLRINFYMRSHQRSLCKAMILNTDDFDPQGTFGSVCKIFDQPNWWEGEEVLLAFSEQRPGMLPNTLQCTGQLSTPLGQVVQLKAPYSKLTRFTFLKNHSGPAVENRLEEREHW